MSEDLKKTQEKRSRWHIQKQVNIRLRITLTSAFTINHTIIRRQWRAIFKLLRKELWNLNIELYIHLNYHLNVKVKYFVKNIRPQNFTTEKSSLELFSDEEIQEAENIFHKVCQPPNWQTCHKCLPPTSTRVKSCATASFGF